MLIVNNNKEEIKKRIKTILTEKDKIIFAYLHGSFNEIYSSEG